MLKLEPDGDTLPVSAVLVLNLCGLVIGQFNNYYIMTTIDQHLVHCWIDWADADPPQVKTEILEAGRETRIRCQIKERFRYIQNGLNLTWDYKPCQAGSAAACMEVGVWSHLCGGAGPRCPPILTLLEPRAQDSGLYRCHITLDGSLVTLNVYMLQFTDNRREPPVIVGGMVANVTVVAPLLVSLQCKVSSPVPLIIRWFRRLETNSSPNGSLQSRHNFIQYLNNTYQLLNCCPVAALSQKDLHLSKLVISSSSMYDSGFYICLAINDANYTLKETYLNVLPLMKATGGSPQARSFLVLFLIPALFALIPTLVWLMCLRPRKLVSLNPTVPPSAEKPLVVQTHVLCEHPAIPASK